MADDRVSAELAAIRKLADGATAGPWRPMDGKLIVETEAVAPEGSAGAGLTTYIATLYMTIGSFRAERRNTEFIAAARSDVPRLLAAVEAVLAMHQTGRVMVRGHLCGRHEAHRYFSIDSHEAADIKACPDCTATVSFSCTGCHASVSVDSCPVRAAIERALTGEDGSDAI